MSSKIIFGSIVKTPEEIAKANFNLCMMANVMLTVQIVHQVANFVIGGVKPTTQVFIHGVALTTIYKIGQKWPEMMVYCLAVLSLTTTILIHFNGIENAGILPKASNAPPFLTDMSEEVTENDSLLVGNEARIKELEIKIRNSRKPSTVLVGKPGIGKSAVLKGVVSLMKAGKIDDKSPMKGKRIYQLDYSSFLSETTYVGQIHDKIKSLLAFTRSNPDVYVFIDELYLVLSAGRYHNNPNSVANYLLVAIEKNEIRIIGASTPEEWRKSKEEIPAFGRRFQDVPMSEPSSSDCVKILKKRLEGSQFKNDFPTFSFTDAALNKIVEITTVFEPHLGQPDKAITAMEDIAGHAAVGVMVDEQAVVQHLSKVTNSVRQHRSTK